MIVGYLEGRKRRGVSLCECDDGVLLVYDEVCVDNVCFDDGV